MAQASMAAWGWGSPRLVQRPKPEPRFSGLQNRFSERMGRGASAAESAGYGTQRAALLDGSAGVPPGLSRYTTWQFRQESDSWLVASLTAS